MAYDPRSIIGEILSRRPDLRRAYAPQAQALGIQIAGLQPAVEARRRLEAANALRAGQVQDTTLGPVPPNMGDMRTPLPPASSPLPTPEFSGETSRRLTAANALRGAMSPGYAGYEAQRANMLSPMGDQGPMQPLPGSMDYGRERERALMRSPFGDQGPLDPGNALPPELATRGPMPPSFGADPSLQTALESRVAGQRAFPFTGNPPQPRPSFAPGTAERLASPLAPLPQARPSYAPGSTDVARLPQSRPPMPGDRPAPTLASDTSGMSPQIAALMGPQSPLAPSSPPNSSFSPYGPNASLARIPQARPDMGPAPGPPPPLSPDQRIANSARDVAQEAVRQQAAARAAQPPPGSPGQPRLLGAGTSLDLAGAGPKPPLGSTVLSPDNLDPTAQFASVGERIAPYVGTGAGTMTARLPRPRPDFSPQLGDIPPAGTAPLGTVTGQDLPAPGQTSSILTPEQIQRTMQSQALYNQPPPGMVLPPGVTLPDVGRLGFGGLNVDPSKAPVHRYGSNTGKYAGAALGAVKGLAGGPLGAGIGAALGYQGGKRFGGLADRDFGLGARFSNPNYAQGVVANPPAIMGVEPISQPVNIPVTTTGQAGIFGRGMRGLGQKAQGILAQVASGAMSIKDAAAVSGMSESRIKDALGSTGGGGGGMGGWSGSGGWGGGSSYTGGNYGGNAGGNIMEGIGQRFGQR